MNSQEGIYVYGIADPSVKKLLPPPLELTDPDNPMFYLYIVNIREPSFGPWYLEGGIGVLAKYGEKTGIYFFNLQLSGPGALMGALIGREMYGLPKKLCEQIVVERTDEYGHCYIERNGVRLVDVELEIGQYNIPSIHMEQENCKDIPGGMMAEGGCLLHKYHIDGEVGFTDMGLMYYDSPTRYYSWEPATATVKLASSIDDPWGEISVISILGATWAKCDNWIEKTSIIYRYPPDAAVDAMQYIYAGRYDRSLLCSGHQRYETR
jgi:acetoacetate decarboxylase